MSPTSVQAEIRKLRRLYPERRSAVLPALRLAQEEHGGWLSPDALVADMIAAVGSLDTVMGECDR